MLKLELGHIQRLQLCALVGAQQGNVSQLRLLLAIFEKVELTNEEKQAINWRIETGPAGEVVRWDPERSVPRKTIELEDAQAQLLRAVLQSWNGFSLRDHAWLMPLLAQLERQT